MSRIALCQSLIGVGLDVLKSLIGVEMRILDLILLYSSDRVAFQQSWIGVEEIRSKESNNQSSVGVERKIIDLFLLFSNE